MEIEAKYSVLHPDTALALVRQSHLAGFDVQEESPRTIHDTYLDTPDLEMMAAGYACRQRDNGATTRINLKGLSTRPGTVHRREEMAVTMDRGTMNTPKLWPESEARDLVLDLTGGQDLVILLEIEQQRQIHNLMDAQRGAVAERSLDKVTLRGEGWEACLTELEVELLEAGVEEDITQVVDALSEIRGLVPQPTSKFERGIGLLYRHAGIGANLDLGGIQPDHTIGEATRRLLRPLFLRMQIHEQGTYQGSDPEELHDMRVMTRRMRTAFRMAEPYLAGKGLQDIRKGLRKTARLLGAVRDMDVFRQKTESIAEAESIPLADLTFLMQTWDVAYAARRNAMLDYLDSGKYGEFKHRCWSALCAPLPERDPAAPVRDVVHRIVDEQLTALLSQGEVIEAPDAPLAAYHQLRIDVKHLRYTLSFFQTLLGPETAAALEVLEALQDYFGDLQDAVVAVSHLQAVLQYGTWEKPQQVGSLWHAKGSYAGSAPGLQALLEARRAEIERLIAAADATWQTFHNRDTARLVQDALTVL